VHQRVEAFELSEADVAGVAGDRFGWGDNGAEAAILVEARIEAHHAVAALLQESRHDAAQISLMSGD